VGLTLPNQLTLFRMILIPFFVVVTLYGHTGWALAIFVLAGVTDGLDGLVARRTGQRSELGAFLDPAADKLLMTAAFIVLSLPPMTSLPEFFLVNRLPVWLTVLVISRDILIVLVALLFNLAMGVRRFPPTLPGKIATGVQITTVSVFLLLNALEISLPWVAHICVSGCLLATVASGLHYAWYAARSLANDSEHGA
jgi:cardiolipin synthase